MSHPEFPHLLAPLRVAHLTLPNRVLMGSMHIGLEEDEDLSKLAAFFAARASAGLVVTGGVAPNRRGWLKPFAAKMNTASDARKHRVVTEAVHAAGGRIAMQILHAGRYAYHPFCVAPSRGKAPISPFAPWALTGRGVRSTIADFARSAKAAQQAGYDGVEIMGSEGYLINQFICRRTNHRSDEWGGSYENRIRFPIEIVRAVREAVGADFAIVFRLSMLDLVEEGSTFDEVVTLALALESAGVSLLNTGIGWHEARVPTIATMVPRAGFAWVTKRLMGKVKVPLCTSNRINMPAVGERVLAEGCADMISMARPFLADPEWVLKAQSGRVEEINTCIACNQACLDHIFENRRASCLVNPRACHETELVITPAKAQKRVAVVGAGPAGLAAACTAAERGHAVTLFERSDAIGGQFNMAKKIPGKEEFHETLRYFRVRLEKAGVTLRLGTEATVEALMDFDEVIVAAGVHPRRPELPGIDHPMVLSYVDVLARNAPVGPRVVIIGAGGIGFDVAEFLSQSGPSSAEDPVAYQEEWGIDTEHREPGGLKRPTHPKSPRHITLCQRRAGKLGNDLGKTTGWIHRSSLKNRGIEMLSGCTYLRVEDGGLLVRIEGQERLIACDNVVVCAGQEPARELADALEKRGRKATLIGGAELARDLDAKRAIDQGTRVAAGL